MERAYYSNGISEFIEESKDSIIGKLAQGGTFDITQPQRKAWSEEIDIVKNTVRHYYGNGKVYFEYEIPRLGGRIDVLVLIRGVIFVIEFKVGASEFSNSAINQVCDYSLDLKNFHKTSHGAMVAPILVATEAKSTICSTSKKVHEDKLLYTTLTNAENLPDVIAETLKFADNEQKIDSNLWEVGRYSPTPTIIEAATALYRGHSVEEISRSESGENLTRTSKTIANIIELARNNSHKSICFVTGVPGAGKTLVGLDIATKYIDKESDLYSVFLSGNGPLVKILREALAQDKVRHQKEIGNSKSTLGKARTQVKTFIQNVHNFRDEYIKDQEAPLEHVAIFDEAQRAWNLQQTSNFMKRRKNIDNFDFSEPEFLISCLDRHTDWATIICLVGGGQEINTGESGISEWIAAICNKFPEWHIYISPHLKDGEYKVAHQLLNLKDKVSVEKKDELHLSVSMRSFRAENVSSLVGQLLDLETDCAKQTLAEISPHQYPIFLTRDLNTAKNWLRGKARGSERYGIMVSSRAARLKPYAVDIRPKVDPIHWFLKSKEDVRSSYYLEDVVTEFDTQGLEIDWTCVAWDADFRYTPQGWENWSFKKGKCWNRVSKPELQNYQKNAYRVLLTRARQGMVIVVPEGSSEDPTRDKSYYNPTFNYLREIGFKVI